MDLAAGEVLLDGERVALTGVEFKLLRYLVENCSRAISREELRLFLESFDIPGAASRSIDVYVGRVRRKLRGGRHAIATVRGGGYQFVPGPHGHGARPGGILHLKPWLLPVQAMPTEPVQSRMPVLSSNQTHRRIIMSPTLTTKLQPGTQAPDFTLPDAEGKPTSLADYRGKNVIVYFYPEAATPGCTTEACDFRDSLASPCRAPATRSWASPPTPRRSWPTSPATSR